MARITQLPFHAGPVGPMPPQLRNGIAGARINGSTEIVEGTIFARTLVVGAQAWNHNLTWTATDHNTISWSSGSIQFAGGETIAIDAGNTGAMSARTYIFYNGSSVLQISENNADAVGENNVLLAIGEPVSAPASAIVTAIGSPGTTIDGDKIVTGRIQSGDARSYFDLDLGRIVIEDATHPRFVAGDV